MLQLLAAAALPALAAGQVLQLDHMMLQLKHRKTCDKTLANVDGPTFEPRLDGADRVCRGADSKDPGEPGLDYVFFHGVDSLDECKGRCADTPGCRGIEFRPKHCEVWIRPGGIGATATRAGYTCLRVLPASPVATTTTTTVVMGEAAFEPVDGGDDRACRGAGPGDKGSAGTDFEIIPGASSLQSCMAHCAEAGAATCNGVEFGRGRCEMWTRMGGIGTSSPRAGFTCLRYRPVARAGACGAYDMPQEGQDLAGSLIAAVHGESPAQCCLACTAAIQCEGFAYVAAGETCYLKANVTGMHAKPGVTAQVKHMPTRDAPTCEGFGAPEVDRDIVGVELDQAHAISAEYCCGACELAAGCMGFAYLPELQMCYLKANVTGTYAHPGRVSQLRPIPTTPPPTARPGSCDGYGTLMADTEVGGVPLGQVHVHTVDECCGACDQAPGCEGFAYLDEHKTCYLKAYVTGTFPKAGPIARLKKREGVPDHADKPICSSAWADEQEDTDVTGRLLGEVPAVSPSQCCGACDEITACEAFTYYELTQACYLKAEITGTYANPGRVSRVKPPKDVPTAPAPTPEPTPEPASCGRYSELEDDTDVIGTLLKEETAASADACCGLCDAEEDCDGFAYLQDYHRCYLKARLTGTYHKEGSVARMRPGATAPRDDPVLACKGFSELREHTDVAGTLISEVHGESATQCCTACVAAPGCEGFAFLGEYHQCYLKADVMGTFSKTGCVARTLVMQ